MTTPGLAGVPLLDPATGRPLWNDRLWSLTDGQTRWPVVEGIPYLRVGRESLRRSTLEALDAGDDRAALVALLADQDDFARIAPPDPTSLSALVDAVGSGDATLRDAMAGLNYGPVADYFAHRWSAPTYLSGLALLALRPAGSAVVEVACGIGHYLRDLARSGVLCGGLDVVFSKLWLARRFLVGPEVGLVCGDASAGWPLGLATGSTTAFCHDAFYFLPAKERVVASMRGLVGESGTILIGHAHNRLRDHGAVAGEPRTPGEYAGLLPGCTLFDDAELARSAWAGTPAPTRAVRELDGAEAVAMVWPSSSAGQAGMAAPPGSGLRLNPLLIDDAGSLRPRWPSPRFEAEYAADSPYLTGEPTPSPRADATEIGRLARHRILLDLPERW